MFGGSSKVGRGGGRGGGGGSNRNRSSFPLPTHRHPSPVGRMSSGSGSAAPRQRGPTSVKTAASTAETATRAVEETFSLVPRESPPAFGMIIRLTPELVEEIRRVEAQGGGARIKFDAFPNNSTGNIIDVGGKEFKFTWSREVGEKCAIYEERQSGEDGNGVLVEAGCAWRKLNVQRTLDESTTSQMKMRSVEAEQRTKLRKAIVLDPGTPSLTKQLALAEGSPWRSSNKQKKEPPPKKRKVDPPPVPTGGPKPPFRPGSTTPAMKNRLSASPGPSPPNQFNSPPLFGIGNTKAHAPNENVTPVQKTGRENIVASKKEPSPRTNNVLRDTSGRQASNVNKTTDLQTILIELLKEAPMSLKALDKAVGDRIPTSAKKIEPILKKIANFQAPGRYFLKPGVDVESYKKHSPESGSSPEHQQSLPITESSRDQLSVQGNDKMENSSVCEQNVEEQHLVEQLSARESVDIEQRSPGTLHEEKPSENREGQAPSSSDSDSDSDNSDSASDSDSHSKSAAGSDSASSSDSEASSNSKEGSDEDVDIMSDGDGDPGHAIQLAEHNSINLAQRDSHAVNVEGHNPDAVDIEGHDSDTVDIDGHESDAVDVEGHSSDEGQRSEADKKMFSENNWRTEAITGTSPTTNEEIGNLGEEHFASGHDKLRERETFIGQLFDDTENATKDNLKNEQPNLSKRLPKDQNPRGPDLEIYVQEPGRMKNVKSQSLNQLPTLGDSHPSDRKYNVEVPIASVNQTTGSLNVTDINCDPRREPQKASIEKSNRHGQIKPVGRSGKSNKHSAEGDRFQHEMLPSRSGKVFKDNQRDDTHVKDKISRDRKDGESAIRPSLLSDTSNRKHGELDGNGKDPKNVSGLNPGSSPFDSQRTYLANVPKGNGALLQKQVSDLELGELREPLSEDTALMQLKEKSSLRQSNYKLGTSDNLDSDFDKRRSRKSDSKKPTPSHADNGIKGLLEHVVEEDSERSQRLQSHGQNLTGKNDAEIGTQHKSLEDATYTSRHRDSGARVGSSVEGYGETNKKTPVVKHGSKRASTSRSSRESKRHASGAIANSTNGHNGATLVPGDGVLREERVTSFDDEDSSYFKYEKASAELKGPISDHLQYKAYMQEYLDKYDSYFSINKILESYRNDFQKLGEDLEFAKGRDTERYNRILRQLKESYCKHGDRHKRLKKVFIVLHEELKQLKQRMKEYASSRGKD